MFRFYLAMMAPVGVTTGGRGKVKMQVFRTCCRAVVFHDVFVSGRSGINVIRIAVGQPLFARYYSVGTCHSLQRYPLELLLAPGNFQTSELSSVNPVGGF